MNDKAEAMVVDGVKLDVGKIYLRDKRNGRVFQYEEALSQLSYIERFEFDGTLPSKDSAGFTRLTLTGQERAAEWDRLASLPKEEREAAIRKQEAYRREQEALREKSHKVEVVVDEHSDDAVMLLNKEGPTLKSYYDKGWTAQQLIEQKLATAKA